MTTIPSPPGWRLAVIGPDEDLEACPIVAWREDWREDFEQLVPLARLHGQDGQDAVRPWAARKEYLVGILAPGEELDIGWQEAANEVATALREQEASR